MKLIFMGTPDFAAVILEKLVQSSHEVLLAVTREDKPKGRSRELSMPPVKECAMKHGIPIFQPKQVRDAETIACLREKGADIIVVAAYGRILPKELLEMPRYGCVNVHASLLPKYRGASPIQRAILNGDKITGVTVQQMNEGVDTGDILTKKEVPIRPDETGESLFDVLAEAGASLIVKTLDQIEAGTVTPKKQNDAEATNAPLIRKEDGLLDFSKEAIVLEREIRGFYSWPGAYTVCHGKILKVFKAEVFSEKPENAEPGTILSLKDGIAVACKEGVLLLKEVQLAGKRRMEASDYLRGCSMTVGERLGGD
ncbi:MAG: methionyl-tRNA formyltransferase [Lachnospiraceae bacterium]|nr:methionyl-tRNA formyltransferase [Lachnospiraceae bacterium]